MPFEGLSSGGGGRWETSGEWAFISQKRDIATSFPGPFPGKGPGNEVGDIVELF